MHFPTFCFATYWSQNSAVHSGTTSSLGYQECLELKHRKTFPESPLWTAEGHWEQNLGSPSQFFRFPWLGFVQCRRRWESPNSPWQPKHHICSHITWLNVTHISANVVSHIRAPKWKDDSDAGLEEPSNLPQPFGHYGTMTWKSKCRPMCQIWESCLRHRTY